MEHCRQAFQGYQDVEHCLELANHCGCYGDILGLKDVCRVEEELRFLKNAELKYLISPSPHYALLVHQVTGIRFRVASLKL